MAASRGTRTFRRIVHPSDFSAASPRAFRKALELAKDSRAKLIVLHVLPVLPLLPGAYIAAPTYSDLVHAQRTGGQKELDRLVRKARAPT
jgi:nucleotide-binding universal stress UspA family protein